LNLCERCGTQLSPPSFPHSDFSSNSDKLQSDEKTFDVTTPSMNQSPSSFWLSRSSLCSGCRSFFVFFWSTLFQAFILPLSLLFFMVSILLMDVALLLSLQIVVLVSIYTFVLDRGS